MMTADSDTLRAPSNILTVDVEDYFMVSALEQAVDRGDWGSYESRVERNTHRILDILQSCCPTKPSAGAPPRTLQATFFCLGWVAERYPRLIKDIHSRGYEIASHGYEHRVITSMSPRSFREDIRRAKAILEDITGEKVEGFRAPSYTITRETLWALEILAEEGFTYDSSVFPVHHDRYGIPDAPRSPFYVMKTEDQQFLYAPFGAQNGHGRIEKPPVHCNGNGGAATFTSLECNNGNLPRKILVEFPLTTIRILGQNLPVAGGGYFRLLPVGLTKHALRRANETERIPFIFYIHPWELDPDQPRIRGVSLKSRFRHYLNLDKTEGRLRELLRASSFTSFRDFIVSQSVV